MTRPQMQALHDEIFTAMSFQYFDLTDKLCMAILTALWEKLATKLIRVKPDYQLKLDAVTAIAIYVYFNDEEYEPTSFADNFIKGICDKIHQKITQYDPCTRALQLDNGNYRQLQQ